MLLNLFSLFKIFYHVATRKIYITYVAHITFLVDNDALAHLSALQDSELHEADDWSSFLEPREWAQCLTHIRLPKVFADLTGTAAPTNGYSFWTAVAHLRYRVRRGLNETLI